PVVAALVALGASMVLAASALGQDSARDRTPSPTASAEESASGQAIYEQSCAVCHDGAVERAPALSVLQSMTAGDLEYALTEGVMSVQGSSLTDEQRARVVEYLAAEEIEHEAWIDDIRCTTEPRPVDLDGPVAMRTVGIDITSPRRITAEAAGLTTQELQDLEVAWALGLPGVTTPRAAPVIAGSTVFYSAVDTGRLLALDAETGCVRWVYESPAPLRSSVTLGEVDGSGRQALFFGDARARVHAVDARTGEPIWVVNGRVDEDSGIITGSVVVHDGKVIVPLSASGVVAGANPRFECCVGRGAVAALDAATGERLWEYVTMEEADYTGEVNSLGVRLRGPSGAPIWATPTIDSERGRVYVATGENTSLPATGTSDAIIALDMETGKELWVFQATANDVWSFACTDNGPNCPDPEDSIRRDWDFGGAAILAGLPDGSDLLLAGQKSGHLWALNPEDGSVVWQQRVGEGGMLGGNHWGIAIDGERVFLPISDAVSENPVPGMYAFDIATGEPVWEHRIEPDCSGDRADRVSACRTRIGLSATPLVVDGTVIAGGLDGRLHVFDAESGEILLQFDTARPFQTLNGVEARGGSIDSHNVAAGAGHVFVASGYGMFSQMPGNVLLALSPADR
ncbi:MAG: PQQ-binding-like beta-propeller repeat protein, partial [Gemmatimonadota bacterium]